MAKITKDTIIGDILDIAPQTAPIFMSIGMHCLGCPSSRCETVERACMVHGVVVDGLVAEVTPNGGVGHRSWKRAGNRSVLVSEENEESIWN